jgi:hypothetical protein
LGKKEILDGCRYKIERYSLHFKTRVTFGHNLRYETKGKFGETSLKLRQTNWDVASNNVNVVAYELPSQSTNKLHLLNN